MSFIVRTKEIIVAKKSSNAKILKPNLIELLLNIFPVMPDIIGDINWPIKIPLPTIDKAIVEDCFGTRVTVFTSIIGVISPPKLYYS